MADKETHKQANKKQWRKKIIGGKIKKEILDLIYGDDPFGVNGGSIPLFGPVIAPNAAEAVGEAVLDELRQEGLPEEYMDYNRVVRDVSEAVKGGDTPAQAKRYAKQRAIGRSLDLREPKITKFVNPNDLPDLPLGLNHVASQSIEDENSFQGDMSMKRSQDQLSEHSFLPAVQTPEVIQLRKRLRDQIKNSDDYLMNLKSPSDWTKAELQEAMKAREKALPQDKAGMLQRERQWFDHYYGNDPVKYDETGKMVQPAPVRSIPQEPVPIKTKDGKDPGEALERIIGNLPGMTGGIGHALNPPVYNEEKATGPLGSVNGVPVEPGQTGQNRQAIQSDRHLAVMPSEEQVIKGLQAGLNMLSNKQNQSPLPNVPKTTALKEDGVNGPKTSFGLKKALVDHGTSKVSEAVALGQFKETAKKAKTSGVENLAGELGAAFKPLLGNQKSPKDGFQSEGLALQDTLNDLGAGLKDDGIVGPKTHNAFHQIAKKTDEDELTQRFADNLGFSF
ncbi:MAG: hypothetical protein HWE34_12750 [Methylocystaceae bacterium]|nr:hypothetical protein [Methylocystaceae bacterium]